MGSDILLLTNPYTHVRNGEAFYYACVADVSSNCNVDEKISYINHNNKVFLQNVCVYVGTDQHYK
jgi:hypothetical protein